MVSDAGVALALLPERAWHAILIDHALGTADIEQLGEAARLHATQRIVMFTPATRQELQPSASSAFTGYLVKPLRAASLAARLTAAPEVAAPGIAGELAIDPRDAIATPAVPVNKGLSILVAEDNEINALLMRSLLGRLGHHAVITTNGEEALESWLSAKSAGTPYDLVLMDIQMPQLNGIDATKRIRQLEAGQPGRRTAILALTANTLVEDRYACFEAGMDGFLIKPLDRDKLAEALANLPPRGTSRREAVKRSIIDDANDGARRRLCPPSKQRNYSRRSATVSTTWSAPFFRISVARGRVGRMLSSRLARLVRSQIAIAVAVASSSESGA